MAEEAIRFRPAAEVRERARAAFARHRRRILALVPRADVQHVGATSVPGAWTKGDLDLVVRVDAELFGAACSALRRRYAEHQRENWTLTFASFRHPGRGIPVGVQLVVAGSPEDALFVPVRDLLAADPELLEHYNRLKREHEGADAATYLAAKARFMAGLRSRLGPDVTARRT